MKQSQQPINSNEYIFNFGYYIGLSYDTVLKCNPDYLIWAHYHVKWFRLAEEDKYMALDFCLKKEKRKHREFRSNPATEHALEVYGSDRMHK